MAKPRRVSWDACTWIATIIQEVVPIKGGGTEDRSRRCNHDIELARKKQIEIATSGLSLTEVCKDTAVRGEDADTLADFFRNDYILVVSVDRYVGTLGRELMQAGHAGLRPPDAIHIATAVVADASEFHTFDKALLNLDQKILKPRGGLLKICKPPEPPRSIFDV
ncbi:type II toxin-antitoxin system VapC family toxin [Sphingomonas endolithica]|uniref:type II toxin-antitoxin system VapC family toxin n=1 Tax=Sphingomonas endolithica TaxID=2972485 RepID=UPI0021B06B1D|nr:PIN domain-containing protein [Sphingomonas sp. ZFBP2030]